MTENRANSHSIDWSSAWTKDMDDNTDLPTTANNTGMQDEENDDMSSLNM